MTIGKLLTLLVAGVSTVAVCFDAAGLLQANDDGRRVSGEVVAVEAARTARETGELTDEAFSDVLRRALKAAPLASEPLLALAETQRGNEAIPALNEAVRRNLRLVDGRRLRVQKAIQNGRLATAISEVSVLYTLDPENRDNFLNLLVGLERTAEGRAALAVAMVDETPWRTPLIRRLATRSTDLAFVKSIIRDDPQAQALFLERLVDVGQPSLALIAWFEYAEADQGALRWPMDPAFAGMDAPAPFNWSLHPQAAEYRREGGIQITFLGQEPQTIVRQVMALGPGRYDLTLSANGMVPRNPGAMTLAMRCIADAGTAPGAAADLQGTDQELGTRAELASISVVTASQMPGLSTAPLTIPSENCRFQDLRIDAKPGPMAQISRITVRSIDIQPVRRNAGKG